MLAKVAKRPAKVLDSPSVPTASPSEVNVLAPEYPGYGLLPGSGFQASQVLQTLRGVLAGSELCC